jgi:hypothetical protein
MNLEQALKLVRDIVNYLEHQDMFKNGTVDLSNVANDTGLEDVIVRSLKLNGVDIPEKVDAISSAVKVLLPMFFHS